MKLTSAQSSTSFYESFSDLIFATMAIFVLLMIVFMALIKVDSSENLEDLKQELIEKSEQLSEAEFERDNARQQLEEMAEQLASAQSAVTADGLEIVVAVDVSGSMEEPLGHLVETLQTITSVLPRITQDFKVGVVAYRDTGIGQPLNVFPLQKIEAASADGERSFKRINEFLNGLQAENGPAPVGRAVDEALAMLQVTRGFAGFQTFLILGDVGPYEDGNDVSFSANERAYEKPIVDSIANWVGSGERRNVISLFSGKPEEVRVPEYQNHKIKLQESQRFFQDIAVQAGQPENFTRNPAKMLAFLLNAIVEGA